MGSIKPAGYHPQKLLEIERRYKDKQYIFLTCPLCNFACNGLTIEESMASKEEHLKSHSDWPEYEAALPTTEDFL